MFFVFTAHGLKTLKRKINRAKKSRKESAGAGHIFNVTDYFNVSHTFQC